MRRAFSRPRRGRPHSICRRFRSGWIGLRQNRRAALRTGGSRRVSRRPRRVPSSPRRGTSRKVMLGCNSPRRALHDHHHPPVNHRSNANAWEKLELSARRKGTLAASCGSRLRASHCGGAAAGGSLVAKKKGYGQCGICHEPSAMCRLQERRHRRACRRRSREKDRKVERHGCRDGISPQADDEPPPTHRDYPHTPVEYINRG